MPSIAQPRTAGEAQRLKDSLGSAAAFIAGGTVLQLGWGDAAPALTLIDVAALPEAQGIAWAGAGLRIGAATRLERLRRDPLVLLHVPLLAAACETLAALSVRHLATLGGNVGWRCGDTLAALLALDAVAELADGSRVALATWLAADEPPLLVALRLATGVPTARPVAVFEKVGHRAAFSPTRLALALHAERSGIGLGNVRVAVTGAGLAARRLHRVERALEGRSLSQLRENPLTAACSPEFSDPALARLACRLLHGHLAALA